MYVETLPEPPKPKQGFFKRYELGMPLGQGGSGKVYQAKSQNGTLRAVKIVTPDVVERRPRPNGRLIAGNEVELMQKLQHPNIVEIIEYFMCDGDDKLCESVIYV